jgi:hypothetical protein
MNKNKQPERFCKVLSAYQFTLDEHTRKREERKVLNI